jgi:SET domain-containing protein
MFNHSGWAQNVGWTRDTQKLTMTYETLRDVREGEELCISYGDRLTFEDAEKDLYASDDDEDLLSKIEIA